MLDISKNTDLWRHTGNMLQIMHDRKSCILLRHFPMVQSAIAFLRFCHRNADPVGSGSHRSSAQRFSLFAVTIRIPTNADSAAAANATAKIPKLHSSAVLDDVVGSGEGDGLIVNKKLAGADTLQGVGIGTGEGDDRAVICDQLIPCSCVAQLAGTTDGQYLAAGDDACVADAQSLGHLLYRSQVHSQIAHSTGLAITALRDRFHRAALQIQGDLLHLGSVTSQIDILDSSPVLNSDRRSFADTAAVGIGFACDESADKGIATHGHGIIAQGHAFVAGRCNKVINAAQQRHGNVRREFLTPVAATDEQLTTGGATKAVSALGTLLQLLQLFGIGGVGGIVVNAQLEHLTNLGHIIRATQAGLQTGCVGLFDPALGKVKILLDMEVRDVKGNTGIDLTGSVGETGEDANGIGVASVRLIAPDQMMEHILIVCIRGLQRAEAAAGHHDIFCGEIFQRHIDDLVDGILPLVLYLDKGLAAILLADLQILTEGGNIQIFLLGGGDIEAIASGIDAVLQDLGIALIHHIAATVGGAVQGGIVDTDKYIIGRFIDIALDIGKAQLAGSGIGQDGILRTHGLVATVSAELHGGDLFVGQAGNRLHIGACPVGVDDLYGLGHYQAGARIDGEADADGCTATVDGQVLHNRGAAQLETVLTVIVITILGQIVLFGRIDLQHTVVALAGVGNGAGMGIVMTVVEMITDGQTAAENDGTLGLGIGDDIGALAQRLIGILKAAHSGGSGIAVTGAAVTDIDRIILATAAGANAIRKGVGKTGGLRLGGGAGTDVAIVSVDASLGTAAGGAFSSVQHPVVLVNIDHFTFAGIGMGIPLGEGDLAARFHDQRNALGQRGRQRNVAVAGDGQALILRLGGNGDLATEAGDLQICFADIGALDGILDSAAGQHQSAAGNLARAAIIKLLHHGITGNGNNGGGNCLGGILIDNRTGKHRVHNGIAADIDGVVAGGVAVAGTPGHGSNGVHLAAENGQKNGIRGNDPAVAAA